VLQIADRHGWGASSRSPPAPAARFRAEGVPLRRFFHFSPLTCLSLHSFKVRAEPMFDRFPNSPLRCGFEPAARCFTTNPSCCLKPVSRSAAGYRRYGEQICGACARFCVYRDAGLKLEDIRALDGRPEDDASSVLKRRLAEFECRRSRRCAAIKGPS